jgi:hypothetical protein
LNFDGVATFAGAFEKIQDGTTSKVVCFSQSDLDRREREFVTASEQAKTFIFLVSRLPQTGDSNCDLFRRVVDRLDLDWFNLKTPFPAVESLVPEFCDFVKQYGTGYVAFVCNSDNEAQIKPICASPQNTFGVAIGGNVFFLPCTYPQHHGQAVEITSAAIQAAIKYRQRTTRELPEWIAEFAFSQESTLRAQATDLRERVTKLEVEIKRYGCYKGALCYQSDLLVEIVTKILERFFAVTLTIDDNCIEDATLKTEDGDILAIFEIKGVKGNFTRNNVNQVDSHRERLDLSPKKPGVLIMNTLMGTSSLEEKDEPPHPDIIKKAVKDRVILIRTLDLLRYADCVEKAALTKEAFKKTILTEAGWLKVENDMAQVVKE